jgi:hypothetical protein
VCRSKSRADAILTPITTLRGQVGSYKTKSSLDAARGYLTAKKCATIGE